MKAVVVAVTAVLAIAAGGLAYVEWAARTPADRSDTAPTPFEVPKGASLQKVGRALVGAGYVRHAIAFRVWLVLHPKAPLPKAGRHPLTRAMNVSELLIALSGTPIPENVPITLLEGWRLRDCDAFLANAGLIPQGEYIAAASNASAFRLPAELASEAQDLSGYLLPETYMVPPGKLDVIGLIQRQLDAFHQRFVLPYAERITASRRPLQEIVIMASLLEREERDPLLRAQVAGVLYKRLDRRMPLGVDATSRFTLAQWNDREGFLKMLLNKDDPYNTRRRAGLPPGPIGAPGLLSLIAALEPQPTDYWYYLHDQRGRIHFARTLKEHESNRREYGVW